MIYECVEWLQQHPELYEMQNEEPKPLQDNEKTTFIDHLPDLDMISSRVVHGEPIEAKKSVFQVWAFCLLTKHNAYGLVSLDASLERPRC